MHAGEPCPRDTLIDLLWPESEPNLSRNNLSQSLSALRAQFLSALGSEELPLFADRFAITLKVPAESVDALKVQSYAEVADRAKVRGDSAQVRDRSRQAAEAYTGAFMPGYYESWCESMARDLQLVAYRAALQWSSFDEGSNRVEALRRAIRIDPLDDEAYLLAISQLKSLGDLAGAERIAAEMKRAFEAIGMDVPTEVAALTTRALPGTPHGPLSELRPIPEIVALVALSVPVSLEPIESWPVELAAGQHGWAFGSPTSAIKWVAGNLVQSGTKAVVTMGESARLADLDQEIQSIWDWVQPGFVVASGAAAMLTPPPEGCRWKELGSSLSAWRVLETADAPMPAELAVNPPTGDVEGLVRPISHFIGRQAVMAAAEAWLSGDGRVLVVTGPGGVGKTRFTQELALRNSRTTAVRWIFVELAPVATSESAMQSLAEAWVSDQKVNASDPKAVAMAADGRPTIAVLDNLEHLLADSSLTQWLHRLLSLAPTLRIVASSRRRTGMQSEVELSLEPLATPSLADSPGQLRHAESMRLLLDRLSGSLPDTAIDDTNLLELAQICRRLEGLPLAIELAAARLAVLSPRKLIERLARRLDVDGKQKSLESTVSWSLDLVPADTRALFCELSVFRGGFDLEAVETIMGNPDAVDHLAELREVSLLRSSVQAGKHRFQILEVVREFGEAALPAERQIELRERHAEFFANLASRGDARFATRDQSRWLTWLEQDHDNLRVALDYWCATENWERALRMGAELWRFWHVRAHLSEGRSRLNSILQREETRAYPRWRSRALNGLGRLTYLQGDYNESREIHQEALVLSREVEDRDAEALALQSIGAIGYELGDYTTALGKYEESLAIRRELGDQIGIGNSLNWLGIVLTDQGRFDEAEAALQESLAIRREIGDMGGVARALTSMGIIARQTLRPDDARRAYQEALALQREIGDQRAVAGLLSNLSLIAMAEGDLTEAEDLLQEGLGIQRSVGDKWGIATLNANLATVERKRGNLVAAATHLKESLQLRLEIDNRWGVAFCLEGAASLALSRGDPESCLKLHLAAAELRKTIGSPLPESERTAVEAEVEAARKIAPSVKPLSLEDAVDHAFSVLDQALAS
ncbi:MAG: hypothetical protein HONBIEJF_00850 [Fimbriimonadaceae bacterium]|nr:hypothetical protein [Fimbriimonadaceae bacterium]